MNITIIFLKIITCLGLHAKSGSLGAFSLTTAGVLPTLTISGGTNQPWGVKIVILYLKLISSYKICKKKLLLGGHVPPCLPIESMAELKSQKISKTDNLLYKTKICENLLSKKISFQLKALIKTLHLPVEFFLKIIAQNSMKIKY